MHSHRCFVRTDSKILNAIQPLKRTDKRTQPTLTTCEHSRIGYNHCDYDSTVCRRKKTIIRVYNFFFSKFFQIFLRPPTAYKRQCYGCSLCRNGRVSAHGKTTREKIKNRTTSLRGKQINNIDSDNNEIKKTTNSQRDAGW